MHAAHRVVGTFAWNVAFGRTKSRLLKSWDERYYSSGLGGQKEEQTQQTRAG